MADAFEKHLRDFTGRLPDLSQLRTREGFAGLQADDLSARGAQEVGMVRVVLRAVAAGAWRELESKGVVTQLKTPQHARIDQVVQASVDRRFVKLTVLQPFHHLGMRDR